jgi:hypothetical protein
MYKKITHHIIEEHYDHPLAAEVKQKTELINKPIVPYQSMPKSKLDKKTKDYQIYTYPVLKQIEKDSINAWSLLNGRIRSLVISIIAGDNDIDSLMERAVSDIDMISSLLKPVYGDSAAKKFNDLLIAVAKSLVDVIVKLKAEKDTTAEMAKLKDDTKTLAEFAYKANPMWMTDVVTDILTKMEDLYITQAKSRLMKEWKTSVKAADDAYNLMVVKQDNGDASFADIYAAGIIADTAEEEIEDFMES